MLPLALFLSGSRWWPRQGCPLGWPWVSCRVWGLSAWWQWSGQVISKGFWLFSRPGFIMDAMDDGSPFFYDRTEGPAGSLSLLVRGTCNSHLQFVSLWFVLLLSGICVDLPYFPKVSIALKGQIGWNKTAGLALGHRQLLLQLFCRF